MRPRSSTISAWVIQARGAFPAAEEAVLLVVALSCRVLGVKAGRCAQRALTASRAAILSTQVLIVGIVPLLDPSRATRNCAARATPRCRRSCIRSRRRKAAWPVALHRGPSSCSTSMKSDWPRGLTSPGANTRSPTSRRGPGCAISSCSRSIPANIRRSRPGSTRSLHGTPSNARSRISPPLSRCATRRATTRRTASSAAGNTRALDHPGADRARSRPHRRGRLARRVALPRRSLRCVVAPAIRRLYRLLRVPAGSRVGSRPLCLHLFSLRKARIIMPRLCRSQPPAET